MLLDHGVRIADLFSDRTNRHGAFRPLSVLAAFVPGFDDADDARPYAMLVTSAPHLGCLAMN